MTQADSEGQLATAITTVVHGNDLAVSDLTVVFDSVTGTVTVSGGVADVESAQKVGELCRSFAGVKTVDDSALVVAAGG
ncbi:BON domain-containing protein [Nocardia sp. CA-128927]|uniref:BON domain-containing protein n=1 Tax=Nocardia sp. CA-128927 TaxID=3239975 RepID=UPI003D993947